MKILIITDAWFPQVNGVVTTLSNVAYQLRLKGHTVDIIDPSRFKTLPLPGYREIRISLNLGELKKIIKFNKYDAIHIASEGPLGLMGRYLLIKNNLSFTTAVHTKFPEYVNARISFPLSWGYGLMRWFHGAAFHNLVNTQSHKDELISWGFKNLVMWDRAIDHTIFNANHPKIEFSEPYLLYAGRIAVEKNIESFLKLKTSQKKVIVGDGPLRKELERKYPDVKFIGYKKEIELARWYAGADAFVFPSKTDTFGIVLLEALACGTPIAAYPVTGPKDLIINGVNGFTDDSLLNAINQAVKVSSSGCIDFASSFTWDKVAEQFKNALIPKSLESSYKNSSRPYLSIWR